MVSGLGFNGLGARGIRGTLEEAEEPLALQTKEKLGRAQPSPADDTAVGLEVMHRFLECAKARGGLLVVLRARADSPQVPRLQQAG